jgi:VWFA-related protein
MHRLPILAAGWVLCLSALIGARQDQRQAPPVFRAGVELIQLDVSVLDRARRPVRGLAAGDFTVLVDGERRDVVTFKAVDVPPPGPAPAAAWMRDVAPDVVTNARASGRVVAIVIDDGSFNAAGAAELFAIRKSREVARQAVDALGPADLAAVLYTENAHAAQSFTRDRALLLRAIEDGALLPSPSIDLGERGSCLCNTCSINALERLAEVLQSLPQERKTVLYVSVGLPVAASIDVPYNPIGASALYNKQHCNAVNQKAMGDAVRQAALGNVTIQAVDVRGTVPAIDLNIGYLRAMSEDTGGRAVVQSNTPEQEVPALLAETSAYYLLGVEAPFGRDDGRLRRIDVNVGRPDVEVRTRRGYRAPTSAERRRLEERPAGDAREALTSVLPATGVPLEVTVFPFADPKVREQSAVGIVLGVAQPNRGRGAARAENIEVVATAFNPETGSSVRSHAQTLGVRWNATTDQAGRYEVLSRLPVRPGRYEIRVAVKTGDGRTASVYTYAEVPDFRGDDLSLSGFVLSVAPPPRTAPLDAFRDQIPVVPTARRSFRATDRATAWLRIHRRNDAAGSVTMSITNERNENVLRRTDVIEQRPGKGVSAMDHQFDLPLDTLAPGEYLLTAEAVAGGDTARRNVRFVVE